MKIRKEQIEVFEEIRMPDFEDFMVEHLKDFTPLHSKSLGEEGIRTLIRSGIERAKKHGFTRHGPVRFYIETTVLLGIDFDTDPQYPWAGPLLSEPTLLDQVQRADRVYAGLMAFLEAAGGPQREYARRALHLARQIPYEAVPVARTDFADIAIGKMREMHPEKASYLGEPALRKLVSRAVEESRKRNVGTDAGACLFAGLMYAVGHGFADDPKYPWIAHTLTNPAIAGPDKRVERLYAKTMTYLDHVLEHLREG